MKKLSLFLMLVVSLACSVGSSIPSTTPSPSPVPSTTPVSTINPPLSTTVTALVAVNIRKDHTEHSLDIGDLLHGKQVYVVECFDGWARIQQGGWVKGKYLGNICQQE